ncbi:MAG TPA: hypothetical protein GX692_00700 [Acholeplasmataceae bacterium]|nr:hypothetical protein [Acholeplasmataceae bacterium]
MFDIDIFSWEDLVDLIEQYQYVYEWYTSGNLHRRQNEIEILLNGQKGTIEEPIILSPIYCKQLITYKPKTKSIYDFLNTNLATSFLITNPIFDFDNSYVELCFSLNNVGRSVYEEVYFLAEIEASSKLKFREEGLWALKNWYNVNDNVIAINGDAKLNIKVDMSANLVGNVKLPNEEFSFKINWFFTSKHSVSSLKGALHCLVKPEVVEIEPKIIESESVTSISEKYIIFPQPSK